MTTSEMVKRLAAAGCPFLSEVAKRLNELSNANSTREPPPDQVIANIVLEEVSGFFELEPGELLSGKRFREIMVPKHLATLFLFKYLQTNSLHAVARMTGRKDHSSVSNSLSEAKRLLAADSAVKMQAQRLRDRIESRIGISRTDA